MTKLHDGDIITCTITGIETYGIFVSYEEYNGLIHISEISENFVRDVNDYGKVGNTIQAKVIEIDEQDKKIKLSIKGLKKKKKRRPKKEKIKETEHGFENLGNKLDEWIKNKAKEIEKNE